MVSILVAYIVHPSRRKAAAAKQAEGKA
jgi:hypothetical protein